MCAQPFSLAKPSARRYSRSQKALITSGPRAAIQHGQLPPASRERHSQPHSATLISRRRRAGTSTYYIDWHDWLAAYRRGSRREALCAAPSPPVRAARKTFLWLTSFPGSQVVTGISQLSGLSQPPVPASAATASPPERAPGGKTLTADELSVVQESPRLPVLRAVVCMY